VSRVSLPVDDVLPEVVETLRRTSALVLRAPTGAGKTTRVPPALMEFGRVVVLEPRRLAARAAARRIAFEDGTGLGDRVGYHVRFDRQASARTQLLVVTPGILLRQLQDDPFLESVDVLVFDEFHERNLDSDLALGMARLIQQTVRPNLKIVVMSATLETDRVAEYLGGCPVVASEGRLHPVEIVYQSRVADRPLPKVVAEAVVQWVKRSTGDVLVFLPGMGEIRQTERELGALDCLVMILHGDLPPEQQDAALMPQSRRKVVLATNVAETSVTVEGITTVIDSGLARILRHDQALGLDRLRVEPIAQASADQRAGRAGRVCPGVCVRLWSEPSHRARPLQTEPEIRRVDLSGAVLHLLSMGEKDCRRFPWLEAPRPEAVEQAFALLQRLGAISVGQVSNLPKTDRLETCPHEITPLGLLLARLPVQPRLGRLVVEGQRLGVLDRAALAAALLSERDPFHRGIETQQAHHVTRSDLLDRVQQLETQPPRSANFLLQARDQLVRSIRQELRDSATATDPDEGLLRALFAAFPDRLAKRRYPGSRKGVMVGGRGVELARISGVSQPELFLCLDVDAGERDAQVRLASAVERSWIPADALTNEEQVTFDEASERVIARRRLCYEDLLIEETQGTQPDEAVVQSVLATAAMDRFDKLRPAEDTPAGQFRLRVQCLRRWMPELDLPDFADDAMRPLLFDLCAGCRSFEQLRRADWLGTMQGRLTYKQLQAVEQEAPERLEVPSGSRLLLQYRLGEVPILAVRIQEMFGLAETPRIAGGRVRLLLHLLAPNNRPQQVTDDLASFWNTTYSQVRKELRARYPKHAWPEDPWNAQPQRGAKRR